MSYYVRRDAGPVSRRYLMAADKASTSPLFLSRKKSTPNFLDRRASLDKPAGLERDAFSNDCRVCFEKAVGVILLPCRTEACARTATRARCFPDLPTAGAGSAHSAAR